MKGARGLYNALLSGDDTPAVEVLDAWLQADGGEERGWLEAFAGRRGDPIPPADEQDLWRLYALSRVQQILTLGFQPTRVVEDRPGCVPPDDWSKPISVSAYDKFLTALGFTRVERGWSPFFHEIVVVEQSADPDESASVVDELWPAHTLGPMLFSRAGVVVRAGKRRIDKAVAETSPLYWAFRRRNRSCVDASHGWGSNSQWRTGFRRDYALEGRLWFNVDARSHGAGRGDLDGVSAEEQEQIICHRCFVTTARTDEIVWLALGTTVLDERLSITP
ncbi:MAG TPA: hypothetical protein VG939_01760 [Caulobacteraceae bacterium]|nr:hypothetical protein [Caulobacteraceae bacterium]